MVISGSDVRDKLQLDRASFIDFALLLGTDFSRRLKNVGPAKALQFIRTHGSIEQVVEQENKHPPNQPPDVYLEQVEVARMVFDTLPTVPHKDRLDPKAYNEKEVARVLRKFDLGGVLKESHENALTGNHFNDDPSSDIRKSEASTLQASL